MFLAAADIGAEIAVSLVFILFGILVFTIGHGLLRFDFKGKVPMAILGMLLGVTIVAVGAYVFNEAYSPYSDRVEGRFDSMLRKFSR